METGAHLTGMRVTSLRVLVFAPALNFNGTVTIPFTVTDDDGAVSVPSTHLTPPTVVTVQPPAAPSTS